MCWDSHKDLGGGTGVVETETNQWVHDLDGLEAPLSAFQGRVWHTATAIGREIYVRSVCFDVPCPPNGHGG